MESPHADESIVANLADAGAVRDATRGMDTVIHLAATPDDADFMSELLPNNVIGLFNVFDAARDEGVERLVVTSTGQVVGGVPRYTDRPVMLEDGTAPRNHYAVTKVMAEAMADMYAHRHDMSVIVVRPGWLPRELHHVHGIMKSEWGQAVYFSPNDAGRFFRCCVEAVGVKHAVLFATSKSNGKIVFDIEPALELIGYEPQDVWPQNCPHPLPKDE